MTVSVVRIMGLCGGRGVSDDDGWMCVWWENGRVVVDWWCGLSVMGPLRRVSGGFGKDTTPKQGKHGSGR